MHSSTKVYSLVSVWMSGAKGRNEESKTLWQKECKLQPESLVQILVLEYSKMGHLGSVSLSFLLCKLRMRMPPIGSGCGNQSNAMQSLDQPPGTQ